MSPGDPPSYDLCDPQQVALPGRGSTVVWDSANSANRTHTHETPAMLLHGWNIDAPTNFGHAFSRLSSSGRRVVMYDHHGHGQGPRRNDPFTIDDAAADAVAVLDSLDIPKAILVGYSMGGAIGQTFVRDHPERCAGLVLSATSGQFSATRREARQFATMERSARALRRVPPKARDRVFTTILNRATRRYPDWIKEVVCRADPVSLLEAGAALGSFDSSEWMTSIRVPSAFVITAKDVIVPMARQVELATAMGVDALHSVSAGHEVPILNNDAFHAALADAIAAVARKAQVSAS